MEAGSGIAERSGASAAEFTELLDGALEAVDTDDRTGPLLRASGIAVRLRLTDVGLDVRVEASEDPAHHLIWAFGEAAGAPAKLELEMDSETANAYLQGEQSLAVGIARGRVKCNGESRFALLYVPALRLICEPYRRLVRERHPHLALAG